MLMIYYYIMQSVTELNKNLIKSSRSKIVLTRLLDFQGMEELFH